MQQLLYAARLNLDALKHHVHEEPLLEVIERIDELLNQSLGESRSLIVQLSPRPSSRRDWRRPSSGLAATWSKLQVARRSAGRVEGRARKRGPAHLLFQSVRELLFNVVKHARAQRATVTVATRPRARSSWWSRTRAAVSTRLEPKREAGGLGFGLLSIRERVQLLGGRFVIDAAPGRGTRVTIVAPCRRQEPKKASTPDQRPDAHGDRATTVSPGPKP